MAFCGEVSKYLDTGFFPLANVVSAVIIIMELYHCAMVAWWAIDAIGSHTCFHPYSTVVAAYFCVVDVIVAYTPRSFSSSWPWWIITVISLSLLLVRILVRLLLLLPLLPHWSYRCVLMPGKLSHSWSELSWLKRGDFVPVSCNLYNFLATWIV